MQLIKKPKYQNRKVNVKGIDFDSKLESNIYLKILEFSKSYDFKYRLQPGYVLVQPFDVKGNKYRAITYKADFELEINGQVFTIDAKGIETDVFKLKKKLFAYMYGREIICIKSVREFEKWFREEIKK